MDIKKIAFVILLALLSFRADISYSASDEGEEIKNKIATFEEEISFLEKEISRDKDIASWGQNHVALRMTRDLLNRDLSEKKRILDNLKRDLGDELKDEIGFIGQNVEREREIGAGIQIDIGTIKYAQAYIQENIQRKEDLLKILKERLEEFKTKLEELKEKEKKRKELKK